MKTEKQIQKETAKHFEEQVSKAGLSELYALEKRIERHFNAGTLSVKDFATLATQLLMRSVDLMKKTASRDGLKKLAIE